MDSNYTNLAYVEEATIGTTPASALTRLRRTGGSLRPMMGTTRSNEIRSDLRAGPPIRTSESVSGGFPIEWSYGTFDDLLEGIRALAQGQRYLSLAAAQRMADSMTREHLTGRESDVLRLLVQGCCNKTIARQLEIAVGTVKSRLTRARQALRSELLGLHA